MKPINRLIRVFTARKQPYLEFMMIFWERLKTTDLLPCYYLISWLPLIESTMEFFYIVLNSALVLKAVPLVTREKKTSGTQGTSNNALSSKSWIGNYTQGTEWTRIWLYYQPSWQMSLRDPYDPLISCSLKVPSKNTVSFGDRAFSVAAPKLGNSKKNI